MKVYTAAGSTLELDGKLGQGGEGQVLGMVGFPNRVAKVYLSDAPAHQRKVEAMASIWPRVEQLPDLEGVAWPMAALYSDPGRRQLVGFGMRRMEVRGTFAQLYQYPPGAGATLSHREKALAVADLCRTVEALHDLGQVVGDLNDSNVVLLTNGRVGLVDVDSFHACVTGVTYRCDVCMSGYMAPELIGAVRGTDFAHCPNKTFTPETDNFSLAVHAFRMLMNGAHPFHCAALPTAHGSVPAPLPLEKRVERGETPFLKHVAGATTAPFAPSYDALPGYLRAAFQRAFVDGARKPSARPTGAEWAALLERYSHELVTCRVDKTHAYHQGLRACPYCEADHAAMSRALAPAGAWSGSGGGAPRVAPSLRKPVATPMPAGTAVAAVASATGGAPTVLTGQSKLGYWLGLLVGAAALALWLTGPSGPAMAWLQDLWSEVPDFVGPTLGIALGLGALCGGWFWNDDRTLGSQLKAAALGLACCGVVLAFLALGAAALDDPDALVLMAAMGFFIWCLVRHPRPAIALIVLGLLTAFLDAL